MLLSPEGDKVECMVCLNFPTINNEVEYEALVARLDHAKKWQGLQVWSFIATPRSSPTK